MFKRLRNRLKKSVRKRFRREPEPSVWYHPEYRVPLEGLGLETRRSDFVAWSLVDLGILDTEHIQTPRRVAYSELAAVHTPAMLAALSDPEILAPIFGATPNELPMESVARTIRLACGATITATHRALSGAGPQVNLLGGFHHASPSKGGGFSVVNDIAVAIKSVRAGGFEGSVGILDLDAHPPDGTADCVAADPEGMGEVWIGSISGTDWGVLPNVDETVMTGADDDAYHEVLDGLLRRMPRVDLAIVVAGGDVLEIDRFGGLSLSLDGAAERDRKVRRRLIDTPSVWLAAGGYSDDAWKVLLHTVSNLALLRPLGIPDGYNPIRIQFSRVAREITPPVPEDELFNDAELAAQLGFRIEGPPKLLDTYTSEWLEYALYQYGILGRVENLGYRNFRVDLDRSDDGDLMRVYGSAKGDEYLLMELSLERRTIDSRSYLFTHWLTLRHPMAEFTDARPQLPNQEVPGLGLAREVGELLALAAQRIGLAGVALRPAEFHVAYVARYDFSFADPVVEGRFQKLLSDLGHVPLVKLTNAIADGRVTLDGEPYAWEPELMIAPRTGERTEPVPCDGTFEIVTN